jgi:hypothetical protein
MMKSDVTVDHVANLRSVYPENTANWSPEFTSGLLAHITT